MYFRSKTVPWNMSNNGPQGTARFVGCLYLEREDPNCSSYLVPILNLYNGEKGHVDREFLKELKER